MALNKSLNLSLKNRKLMIVDYSSRGLILHTEYRFML